MFSKEESVKKDYVGPSVMEHSYNPNTQKAEPGESQI
jgi:hypothetical protein